MPTRKNRRATDPGGDFVGAIDAGTTGVRCLLFDRNARPVRSAYRETPIATPRPGWVEQDAEAYMEATRSVLQEVLEGDRAATKLAAIGIANQRETVVCWDRTTGRALHPAIVWQDRRTAQACEALRRAGESERIRQRTGLSIDPYFSATKIAWLLEQVPGLRERAESGEICFGTVDAWLLWNLTGKHVTDDTNASRTMLYDLRERRWDSELLALFDLSETALPQIVPSLSVLGPLAVDLGNTARPLIAGVLGDQQAALLGQGIREPGRAQVTWGTGAFLLLHTGVDPVPSRHGLLTTAACSTEAEMTYALEGSVFVAGAAIQWLRDGLGLLGRTQSSEKMAESVPSTDGVVFVPALAGLGAPHWDPAARGTLIGMTRGTRPAHIVRAAIESIAFQTHDVLRAMEQDSGEALDELRVGGGAAANGFLCQFQSDLLGIPVVRPAIVETTALGAAYAAGLATGLWAIDRIADLWTEERRFEPRMSATERKRRIDQWDRGVQRAADWHREDE